MAAVAQSWWSQALTRLGLMTMHYDVAYKSDVGMKRLENQDVAEVYAFGGGLLGVVCDGMGGYSGGEVASRLAADSILQYFRNLPASTVDSMAASEEVSFAHLQEAIQWANQQIFDYAQNHENLSKMGTTCVAVLCLRGRAYVAHVGDSRLYLLRERELLRVTRDHSRIQRLVDEGKIKAEEAEHHPGANVISRVLGQYRQVQVECQPAAIALLPGDRLMLCSDGLVRMVDEHDILEYLNQHASPTVICHKLVEAANQAGGKDNTTVQLVVCRAAPNQQALWLLLLYFFVMLALAGWGRWQASHRADVTPPTKIPGSMVQTPSRSLAPGRAPARRLAQDLSAGLGQRSSKTSIAPPPPVPPLDPLPRTSPAASRRRRRRYRRRRRRRRHRRYRRRSRRSRQR